MKQLKSYASKFTSYMSEMMKDKEFWKYTFLFWFMMSGIYFFLIYAGMASSPTFTYAEF